MKIHKNIEQTSPEWFALRQGKMTASHADAIGNQGKGLDTYIYKLLAEKHSVGEKEHYTNDHIERGLELERFARSSYELENDVMVEEVGFIEYSDYVGCSPDGLVGEDGGIEIKCHDDVKHFKLLVNGVKEIESKYVWQMQMNMLITGRKWWDYVAYNPNFEKSLIVHRFEIDPAKHEALLGGWEMGELKMKQIEEKYGEENN